MFFECIAFESRKDVLISAREGQKQIKCILDTALLESLGSLCSDAFEGVESDIKAFCLKAEVADRRLSVSIYELYLGVRIFRKVLTQTDTSAK